MGRKDRKMEALAVFTAASAVMARKRKDRRESEVMVWYVVVIGSKFV